MTRVYKLSYILIDAFSLFVEGATGPIGTYDTPASMCDALGTELLEAFQPEW